MAATMRRPVPIDSWWEAAEQLADAVAEGSPLPQVDSPVALGPGDAAYAYLEAEGWRYRSIDVPYAHRQVMAVGGPMFLGATMAATAAANRRARRAAERAAAPQWRPLGVLPVLVTSRRLLVLHEGIWQSVWYDAIRGIRPRLDARALELVFESDPPYLLVGPSVPYLSVATTTAMARSFGDDAVTGMVAT